MYIRGILICIYVALVNNEKVLLEQTILNIIYIYIYILYLREGWILKPIKSFQINFGLKLGGGYNFFGLKPAQNFLD